MRESGILMHITSLPGPYGIGSLGAPARAFVDFLEAAGQSWWQVLPLNPTGFGNSPYQALSSFAGNPYLLDLEELSFLLTRRELEDARYPGRADRVDYGYLYDTRQRLLHQAVSRLEPDGDYGDFCRRQDWLADYALFQALKEHFGGGSWLQWPQELRHRQPESLDRYREQLHQEVDYHQKVQYLFFRQWQALREYAAHKGIRFIGDVPIYVPLDSADVWANPELFWLDGENRPVQVAGVPPDAFNADGQRWGNPLYDWQKHRQTGYDWWIRRLRAAGRMVQMIRLDHFRGFSDYWAVPAEEKTARHGVWQPGPGLDFLQTVRQKLPELQFLAEDLGYLTRQVRLLRQAAGMPGMRVLEFAFDAPEENDDLPHRYIEQCVCYTGTHDNPPLGQWLRELEPERLARARAYLGLNDREGEIWGVIRGGMASVAQLFVAQMQDYLELGRESRMNLPGTCSPEHWAWRVGAQACSPELARRIRAVTRRYGRCPRTEP